MTPENILHREPAHPLCPLPRVESAVQAAAGSPPVALDPYVGILEGVLSALQCPSRHEREVTTDLGRGKEEEAPRPRGQLRGEGLGPYLSIASPQRGGESDEHSRRHGHCGAASNHPGSATDPGKVCEQSTHGTSTGEEASGVHAIDAQQCLLNGSAGPRSHTALSLHEQSRVDVQQSPSRLWQAYTSCRGYPDAAGSTVGCKELKLEPRLGTTSSSDSHNEQLPGHESHAWVSVTPRAPIIVDVSEEQPLCPADMCALILRTPLDNPLNQCSLNATLRLVWWGLIQLRDYPHGFLTMCSEFLQSIQGSVNMFHLPWVTHLHARMGPDSYQQQCDAAECLVSIYALGAIPSAWQGHLVHQGNAPALHIEHQQGPIIVHLPSLAPAPVSLQHCMNAIWSPYVPANSISGRSADPCGFYLSSPEILVLQMARYTWSGTSGAQKNLQAVYFPQTIVVPVLGADDTPGLTYISYSLKAIVLHHEHTPQSGHYTALVKQESTWYHLDDAKPTCPLLSGDLNQGYPQAQQECYLLLLHRNSVQDQIGAVAAEPVLDQITSLLAAI